MFFEAKRKKAVAPRAELARLERPPQPIDYMTLDEVRESVGDTMYFDIECFPNFFFIAFLSKRTGKVYSFELWDGQSWDVETLRWLLWAVQLVSFNGNRYDVPLLSVAIVGGVDTHALKEVSDKLILDDDRPRDVESDWQIKIQAYNHIDLIEVAPLQASLKKYAARMHAKRLQELPYSPHKDLTPEQAIEVRDYCVTDLHNTALLAKELAEQITLREQLSKQYGQDLRSKSDAQIAEAIIVSEVQKMTGRFPGRAKVNVGEAFSYDPPNYLCYQTEELCSIKNAVVDATFAIDEHGYPRCPQMQELEVRLGGTVYAMGLGGLHSREKCRALIADDDYAIADIDVASYYPKLILNANIRPSSMGDAFTPVYRSVVDRRLKAKAEGNKVEADSLKITANGTFGKLASSFSAMYAPRGAIQVTLGGQLSILLLIERLYLSGFEVASGNTDGVVVRYMRSRKAELDSIVKAWEQDTGLETEETQYASIYNRDVNNYIAIKPDGSYKVKGVYAEKGSTGNSRLSKNPEALILADAVIAYLTKATPIEQTIAASNDLTRFVIVREVKGGGCLGNLYLGKVVRYFYGVGLSTPITYIESGNKVPNSEGAFECMDLPDDVPHNLDRQRYIREAYAMLVDIGHTKPQGQLF